VCESVHAVVKDCSFAHTQCCIQPLVSKHGQYCISLAAGQPAAKSACCLLLACHCNGCPANASASVQPRAHRHHRFTHIICRCISTFWFAGTYQISCLTPGLAFTQWLSSKSLSISTTALGWAHHQHLFPHIIVGISTFWLAFTYQISCLTPGLAFTRWQAACLGTLSSCSQPHHTSVHLNLLVCLHIRSHA